MSETRQPTEIIYQVYPATFYDSNGDGIGDLSGITEKLDYIKSLHVDAIWISPFFLTPEGPDGDGGYAVSDYRTVDPKFGSNADFKWLLDQAHAKGFKVYTDFVLSHTSYQHEWFQKSRGSDPDFTDFYVWDDGRTNILGKRIPPNNWVSIFGGPAWTYDEIRKQWYFHNFLKSQPALNYNNPAVQQAVLEEMRFWFDQGVDGFRLDALPHAVCDPMLSDITLLPSAKNKPSGKLTWHDYDQSNVMVIPPLVDFLKSLRTLCNSYETPKILLGEVLSGHEGGKGSLQLASRLTDPATLCQMCYTDELLGLNTYPQASHIADMIARLEEAFPQGGNCNCISNHDLPRAASRLTEGLEPERAQDVLRQLYRLFFMLPGSFCLYNGEELALTQARIPQDIPYDAVIDPAVFGSQSQGRDGERTPLPWATKEKHGGFTAADKPYLPLPKSHLALAVDLQEKNPASFLHFIRELILWRKAQPALLDGKALLLKNLPENVLGVMRQGQDQTLVGLFNLSPDQVTIEHPLLHGGKSLVLSAFGSYMIGENSFSKS